MFVAAVFGVACSDSDVGSESVGVTTATLTQPDTASPMSLSTTMQNIVDTAPSQSPTSTTVPFASGTNAPSTTLLVFGPVHDWVRRNSQVGPLDAALDGVMWSIDHADPVSVLTDALKGCITFASELAGQSSVDAVVTDQKDTFTDIGATCSSMAASASSGDVARLTTGRSTLAADVGKVGEIFDALEDLMYMGDFNEAIDTTLAA